MDRFAQIHEVPQEFSSKQTCHNRYQIPQLFKLATFEEGSTCVDYGGGCFDTVTEFLSAKGIKTYVYDPFNRTAEHNQEVIMAMRRLNGVDYVCSSNVLNVIKEEEVRLNVLNNMKLMGKPTATFYFVIYEGDRTGISKESGKGWQNNRRAATYMDEIRLVFPNVSRKGALITAKN